MIEYWLIRHGQSEGNVGKAHANPHDIPLTPLGRTQARHVAQNLPITPDRIVHSPMFRARQTALPCIERFPQVPIETWDVEEFVYLNPVEFANTNVDTRRPAARDYWYRADPDHDDGDGAESFTAFIARAHALLHRLRTEGQTASSTAKTLIAQKSSDDDTTPGKSRALARRTVIYTHHMFMQAVMWAHLVGDVSIDDKQMKAYKQFNRGFSIPNGALLKLKFAEQTVWMNHIEVL